MGEIKRSSRSPECVERTPLVESQYSDDPSILRRPFLPNIFDTLIFSVLLFLFVLISRKCFPVSIFFFSLAYLWRKKMILTDIGHFFVTCQLLAAADGIFIRAVQAIHYSPHILVTITIIDSKSAPEHIAYTGADLV